MESVEKTVISCRLTDYGTTCAHSINDTIEQFSGTPYINKKYLMPTPQAPPSQPSPSQTSSSQPQVSVSQTENYSNTTTLEYYASKPKFNSNSTKRKQTYQLLTQRMDSDFSTTKLSLNDKPDILQRFEYFMNVVNHVCIGFTTIYLSWMCLRINLAGTALHAWLVTIGFCFLMAEAVMCHYSGNVLTYSYKRTTKTTIHWVLQVLGGGLGVIGTLIKLIQKGFLLHTIHGKLGFAALILCLIGMLSGLGSLFSMRVKRFLSPLLNKTFHVFLGVTTFIIAMVAQFYGYQTGFFQRKVTYDFQILMKTITLISMFLCCIGPLQALYQKIRNIINNFN